MPDEQAFTRRAPGANPIALELERLAEQKALQQLGRGRTALAPAPAAPAAPPKSAPYSDLLDRLRSAPGREGETDVLSQIPDDELAAHAQMANAEMDQAIQSGAAYLTKDGDLYTRDPNLNFSPHLAIVHEHEARESPPPTSDEPTTDTRSWRQSIEDQIGQARRMVSG